MMTVVIHTWLCIPGGGDVAVRRTPVPLKGCWASDGRKTVKARLSGVKLRLWTQQ